VTNTCDCGAPCVDSTQGCDRCRVLDGTNYGEAAVIASLREMGTASPTEISTYCGLVREHVYRVLKRLREHGRIERVGEVVEHFETTGGRSKVGSTVSHRYELRSS
jgi:DNA-binding IclR family transcriptional regulator